MQSVSGRKINILRDDIDHFKQTLDIVFNEYVCFIPNDFQDSLNLMCNIATVNGCIQKRNPLSENLYPID